MNIRYAKPIDKDQVVSVWNYCFEDGEDFVKYYFENVYDENNTIIIEEKKAPMWIAVNGTSVECGYGETENTMLRCL